MEDFAAYALKTEFNGILGASHHQVKEHLLVGDLPGLKRGIFDYFTNQAQMGMFYTVFSVCYFYTMFFTFWFNDEGIAFYKCYKNFPARVTFY